VGAHQFPQRDDRALVEELLLAGHQGHPSEYVGGAWCRHGVTFPQRADGPA
jgi:hypothetical protein